MCICVYVHVGVYVCAYMSVCERVCARDRECKLVRAFVCVYMCACVRTVIVHMIAFPYTCAHRSAHISAELLSRGIISKDGKVRVYICLNRSVEKGPFQEGMAFSRKCKLCQCTRCQTCMTFA